MDGPTGIVADLLTVEVNTIVKHSMTGEKAPSLPFALLDIIDEYARALADLGVDLEPYFAAGSDELWLTLGEDAEQLARAEAAFEAAHGRAAAGPEERRDLYNYARDLWPVLDRARRPDRPPTPGWRFSMARVSNGWDSFERLRIAAHEALDTGGHEQAELLLLTRIKNNCARLKFIVQGLQRLEPAPGRRGLRRAREATTWAELIPRTRNELLHSELREKDVPLHTVRPEHRAEIRKIWEVGVERILVQTCVHVDGDVVTRIGEDLLAQHNEAVRDLVLRAHRETMETGLRHWRSLLDVAIELFSDFVRKRGS